jgi:cystathionine beta-lyase/cystathionine gamma-synthase
MGATTTIMQLVSPGQRVVCVNDVYGGTYRLFDKVLKGHGYDFAYAGVEELNERPAETIGEGTRLVWLETPTNPLMNVVDVRAAAEAAHAVGAIVVVDATFTTPYLQRPLEQGADIVLHSTTKYIGGHSDVIGGFAATSDPELGERLRFLQNALGAVPGPFDAWLVLRGVKTLAVRMRRHCENARRVAAFLAEHPAVELVRYPGLESHPQHELARAQMDDFGGMISFDLAGSRDDAFTVLRSTKVWRLGESLGGVESLIEHPGLMTHASTADSPFPVPENLIRLSVGIESADDLIADLEQALAQVPATARAS